MGRRQGDRRGVPDRFHGFAAQALLGYPIPPGRCASRVAGGEDRREGGLRVPATCGGGGTNLAASCPPLSCPSRAAWAPGSGLSDTRPRRPRPSKLHRGPGGALSSSFFKNPENGQSRSSSSSLISARVMPLTGASSTSSSSSSSSSSSLTTSASLPRRGRAPGRALGGLLGRLLGGGGLLGGLLGGGGLPATPSAGAGSLCHSSGSSDNSLRGDGSFTPAKSRPGPWRTP